MATRGSYVHISSPNELISFVLCCLLTTDILYKLLFSRGFYFRRNFAMPDPQTKISTSIHVYLEVMTTSEKSRN